MLSWFMQQSAVRRWVDKCRCNYMTKFYDTSKKGDSALSLACRIVQRHVERIPVKTVIVMTLFVPYNHPVGLIVRNSGCSRHPRSNDKVTEWMKHPRLWLVSIAGLTAPRPTCHVRQTGRIVSNILVIIVELKLPAILSHWWITERSLVNEWGYLKNDDLTSHISLYYNSK